MATKPKMTMDRATTILDFLVQWEKMDPSRRCTQAEDYVALKLSCGRLAAGRQIAKARTVIGLVRWNQAVAATGSQVAPARVDPVRPDPPKTPLIDQLKVIERQNHELVDFLKWLDGTGRLQNPGGWNLEEIVAAFRGIDLRAVAVERKAIEKYAADMQEYWRLKDAADAARGNR